MLVATIVVIAMVVGGTAAFGASRTTSGLTFSVTQDLSSAQKLSNATVPAAPIIVSSGTAVAAQASLYLDDPHGLEAPIAQGSLAEGIPVDLTGLNPGKHSILVTSVGTSGTKTDFFARFFIEAAAPGAAPTPVVPNAGAIPPTAAPTAVAPTGGGDQPLQGVAEMGIFDPAAVGAGQVLSGVPGSVNPQPGDVVEIPSGSYGELTTVNGTQGAYVTYRAAQGAQVVFAGGSQLNGASYVHLDGITFADSSGFGLEITESDNIALTNVTIDGSQDGGMRIYGVNNLYIDGSDISGTNARGTSAASEALSLEQVNNFELLNNKVYNNGEEGIDVKYGSTAGSVHHNAAWSNRGPNIYIDGASDVDIHHNWAWSATSSDKPGIMLAAESEWSDGNISNITVRNNTVWDNPAGGITLWQGNFSGIVIKDNVFAGGDTVPDGGQATVSNNVEGAIPDTSAITGTVRGSGQPIVGGDE